MERPKLSDLHAALIECFGVENVARSLVPDLVRIGNSLRADTIRGNTPDRRPNLAFSILLTGPRAGRWHDWGSGKCGDLVDLHAEANGWTLHRAVSAVQTKLGLSPNEIQAAGRRRNEQPAPAVQKDVDALEKAARMWKGRQALEGSLAERYLREARGLSGPFAKTIAAHPRLFHGPTGEAWPALLARFEQLDGCFAGVLRIFLDRDGRGKAPVDKPKLMRGPCAGAAIHLAPAGEVLGISEGLENGLSVGEACPDLPMWAAGSLNMIAAMKIPSIVKTVIWCRDGDGPDSIAERVTAPRVLAALRAQVPNVLHARPPVGVDFNLLPRAQRVEIVRKAA